jgi:hypothetical protein
MALSNAERQKKYRAKAKATDQQRLEAVLPHEVAIKLKYLAGHWQCTQAEALSRILMDAWAREGRPVPGYDAEGEPIPGYQGKRVTG